MKILTHPRTLWAIAIASVATIVLCIAPHVSWRDALRACGIIFAAGGTILGLISGAAALERDPLGYVVFTYSLLGAAIGAVLLAAS